MATAETIIRAAQEAIQGKTSESSERNAVASVLARQGYSELPASYTGRAPDGRAVRAYVWEGSLPGGDGLVLITGPNVEGEVHTTQALGMGEGGPGIYIESAPWSGKTADAAARSMARAGSSALREPAPKGSRARAVARAEEAVAEALPVDDSAEREARQASEAAAYVDGLVAQAEHLMEALAAEVRSWQPWNEKAVALGFDRIGAARRDLRTQIQQALDTLPPIASRTYLAQRTEHNVSAADQRIFGELIRELSAWDPQEQARAEQARARQAAEEAAHATSFYEDPEAEARAAIAASGPGNWEPILDLYAPQERWPVLADWLDRYARSGADAKKLLDARDYAGEAGIHGDDLDEIARRAGFSPLVAVSRRVEAPAAPSDAEMMAQFKALLREALGGPRQNGRRRRNIHDTGGLGQGGFMGSGTATALRGSSHAYLGSSGYRVGGSPAEESYAAARDEELLAELRRQYGVRSNPARFNPAVSVFGPIVRSQYPGVFADSNHDGIPDVDDPNPHGPPVGDTVEEVLLSDEIGKLIDARSDFEDAKDHVMRRLQVLGGPSADVSGRVKSPYSMINKLRRKRLQTLTDMAGTMVGLPNYAAVEQMVSTILGGALGQVLEHEDFYAAPNNGYRAHHFTIRSEGKPVEVQVKTKRQKAISTASHEAYKHGTLNARTMDVLSSAADAADRGDTEAARRIDPLLARGQDALIQFLGQGGPDLDGVVP